MTRGSAFPDRNTPRGSRRRQGGQKSRANGASPTRRHITRLSLVVLGAVIYLPAMVLMTIQAAGGIRLQGLFDWLTGRCGATCSTREVLATAIQIAPIIVTAPVLAWIAYIWVMRGRRDDRQIGTIEQHFEAAPERISPYAVDDTEDRYLYRDRRGRLRPIFPDSDKDERSTK